MIPSIDQTGAKGPPEALVEGTVEGWHIAVLFTLVWLSMGLIGAKLARHTSAEWRSAVGLALLQALTASVVVLIAFIVPDLRRSLRPLYSNYERFPTPWDIFLFLAVMLAWVYGLNRLAVVFPLILWHPAWAPVLGVYEHFVPWDSVTVLLMVITSGMVAPLAEELVFRGLLFNLWRRQWGLVPGILLSSVLFGLFHIQFAAMATVAGIFFSLAYLKFGSLWPGTLLHGLWNLISLPVGITWFAEKSRADMAHLSAWTPELFLTAAFFPLLWLFWRRFRPAT